MFVKIAPVPGFTKKAVADWANSNLSPGCSVISDGLACFTGVKDAGCDHQPIVVGTRKPKDMPQLEWINTILSNLKTSLGGTYHSLNFDKYGLRYLAAFVYRFNRRFHLDRLPMQLLRAAVASKPHPERLTRTIGVYC